MKKNLLSLLICLVMLGGNMFAQASFFTSSTAGCAPVTVTLTNQSHFMGDTTKNKFAWYVDNVKIDSMYNTTQVFWGGGHFIQLFRYDSTGNFIGSFSNNINIDGTPGMFYPENNSTFCSGEMTNYYINSSSFSNLNWDFGDATMSNNYVNKAFSSLGTKTVTLYYNSFSCPSDTITQNVIITNTIIPNAQIGNSANSACPNDLLSFWNNNATANSFLWYFGDGDTSTMASPQHSYADTGMYKVKLVAMNLCGNVDVDSLYIHINNATPLNLFINANPFNPCPYEAVSFSSFGAAVYNWNLGDGSTSNKSFFNHLYADTGSYTITLIGTNNCGNSDTATSMVNVQYPTFNNLFANILFEGNNMWGVDTLNVCPGESFGVRNNTFSNSYLTYRWEFGDGDSALTTNATHSYTNIGKYQIMMILTSSCMQKDTAYKWVKVVNNMKPMVNLQAVPPSICPGENVYFFDNQNGDKIKYSYSVWFGDGDSLVNINSYADSSIQVFAKHTYADTGLYMFTFKATNSCGLDSIYNGMVYVGNPNMAQFTLAENSSDNTAQCVGEPVRFFAVGGVSYEWNFGDNTTDTGMVAMHAFNAPGTYSASVIITSGCGTKDTLQTTANITNSNFPNTFFDMDKAFACGGDTVKFNYQGNVDPSTAATYSYVWDFGDGDTAFVQNPWHVFSSTGSYMVNLTVTNMCGNSSSQNRNVSVVTPTTTFTGLAASAYCANDNSLYLLTGIPAMGTFTGSGIAGSNFNPSVSGAGQHAIVYDYVNSLGCSASSMQTATVNVPPTADAGMNAAVCAGGNAQLQASGGGNYLWSPSTGLDFTNISNPSASPSANTTYTVSVSDGICSSTDTVLVSIAAALTANAGLGDTICTNQTIQLMGTGGGNYAWSPSTGLSNDSIANPIASPTVTTVYVLTVYSGACTNMDTVVVTVGGTNVTFAPTTNTVCLSVSSLTLSGGLPTGGMYIGTGVSNGVFSPSVAGVGLHTIWYSYTSALGCVDSTSATITVNTCNTSVDENSINGLANIYPNPSEGLVNVQFNTVGETSVAIYDSRSQLIASEKYSVIVTGTTKQISLDGFAKGVYFVRVATPNGTLNKRVVLQ
ncbi:MAG: PKD domain-containing protein [Bacteroidetes bacterium]|nr:PKD domain-containing protein [Bacteroidota bacterium]